MKMLWPDGMALNAQVHATKGTKEAFIKEWLIVSRVTFAASKDGLAQTAVPGLYVSVAPAAGHKCPRCWQYDTNENEFGLCSRCEPIVKKIELERGVGG